MATIPTAASLASAAAHITHAYRAAGLSPSAFADLLRKVAENFERNGERAIG